MQGKKNAERSIHNRTQQKQRGCVQCKQKTVEKVDVEGRWQQELTLTADK